MLDIFSFQFYLGSSPNNVIKIHFSKNSKRIVLEIIIGSGRCKKMIKYTVASIQSEASQSDARDTIFFFIFDVGYGY